VKNADGPATLREILGAITRRCVAPAERLGLLAEISRSSRASFVGRSRFLSPLHGDEHTLRTIEHLQELTESAMLAEALSRTVEDRGARDC